MTFARDQLLRSADHVNALKRKNFLRAPVPVVRAHPPWSAPGLCIGYHPAWLEEGSSLFDVGSHIEILAAEIVSFFNPWMPRQVKRLQSATTRTKFGVS